MHCEWAACLDVYVWAADLVRERGEPSWSTALGMVTLGFISATMGIQVGSTNSHPKYDPT